MFQMLTHQFNISRPKTCKCKRTTDLNTLNLIVIEVLAGLRQFKFVLRFGLDNFVVFEEDMFKDVLIRETNTHTHTHTNTHTHTHTNT